MATRGIGDSAIALIRARSPNMVADHIRTLRTIAAGAIRTNQDHVTGTAHVELSKIAIGLAGMDTNNIMPPSLYSDACDAFGNSVDEYILRTSSKGGLMDDIAWSWVTMSHAEYNLAWVVIAGVSARRQGRMRHRRDFEHGAKSLVTSLIKLSNQSDNGFLAQGHAVETAYMAVLGSMGLSRERLPVDLVPRLWSMVVHRLLDPTHKEVSHEIPMLSMLLLHGVYEAVTPGPSAEQMRAVVVEALRLTYDISDERHRRRRARPWVAAGRAALGSGDHALAATIAGAIALDVRADRSTADGAWQITEGADEDFLGAFFAAGQPMPRPRVPTVHAQPDVVAAFQELLDSQRRRRPPRKRPAPPMAPPNVVDDLADNIRRS